MTDELLSGSEPGPGSNRYFNYRGALHSAVIGAGIVTGSNLLAGADVFEAAKAGITQGAYIFAAAGFYLRMSEWLATRPGNVSVRYWQGALIPAAVSFAGAFGLQYIVDSPNPLLSAAVPLAANVPLYMLNSSRFQRERRLHLPTEGTLVDRLWHGLVRAEWGNSQRKSTSDDTAE